MDTKILLDKYIVALKPIIEQILYLPLRQPILDTLSIFLQVIFCLACNFVHDFFLVALKGFVQYYLEGDKKLKINKRED